jgi:hypothetical protein
MSTTAQKPATTPIPVQLSETEFTAFIFPHLSMPRRGPKCKRESIQIWGSCRGAVRVKNRAFSESV